MAPVRTGRTTAPALQARPAGHALLIHPKGEPDPQAVEFAAGLAPDAQHLLVVVDLPFGALDSAWESVAKLLAARPGSLRLVFGRATPQEARRAGQAIADRLDRVVLSPDGEVLPTAGGGLFIPADHGAGWLRMRPGREPERDSLRFPKPLWEFSTLDRPWGTSPYGVVESVPSGVWVRSARPRELLAGWRRLIDRLPSDPTVLTVVLGCPGGPAVPLADVIGVWQSILPTVRFQGVRFVHFGPVAVPEGGALGQALADAFGEPVTLWTGIPLGAGPLDREVPGWEPFVRELVYTPGSTEPPAMIGLRPPLPGARRIGAGLYEYTADAVLEVVQCGLWMRPSVEPADGDEVRRIPAAPGYSALLYDRSTPQTAERMRGLAEDMLWRLEPAGRAVFRLAPADDPAVAAPPGAEDAWSLPEPSSEPLLTGPLSAERRPAHIALWADLAEATSTATTRETATEQSGQARRRLPALGSLSPDEVAHGAGAATATVPRPAAQAAPHAPALARTESGNASAPAPAPSALPRTESDASSGGGALPSYVWPFAAEGEAVTGPAAEPATATGWASASGGGTFMPAAVAGAGLAPAPQPEGGSGGPAGQTMAAKPEPSLPAAEPGGNSEAGPTAADPDRLTPDQPYASTPDLPAEGDDNPGTPSGKTEPAPPARPALALPNIAPATGPTLPPPATPDPTPGPGPAPAPERTPAPDSAPLPEPTARPTQTPEAKPAPPPTLGPAPAAAPTPEPVPAPASPRVGTTPDAPSPFPGPRLPSIAGIRLESSAPDAPPSFVAADPKAPTGEARRPPAAPAAPAPAPGGVRVQPVPKASACAVPPERGIEQERDWVRRTFSAQYNAMAGTVSRVMSEAPGLRGGSRSAAAEALTDLVAVRLYLTGDSAEVDAAVRGASVGPHVPLARCIASGLRRLPSYRGAALLRARLSPAERDWYREGRLVTEWAFCTAFTEPHPAPARATDVLIWSMTARRTSLLDPAAPDRVVFLPGTTFRVLRVDEDGGRPMLLLRELAPNEPAAGADAAEHAEPAPLDGLALAGLERAAEVLKAAEEEGADNGHPGARFGAPPGLLTPAPVGAVRKGAQS